MKQHWLPIADCGGRYEVSDHGNVRSWTSLMRGDLLKLKQHKSGHLYVDLRVSGTAVRKLVHRMVLEAFVGPAEPGQVCRHLNGNPTDNTVENLRWGTPAENVQDMLRHGTQVNLRKTKCIHGHPFDELNTMIKPNGQRQCRACHHIRARATRDKSRGKPPLPKTADRTHCPHGHAYDETNTRIGPSGARFCRECDRIRGRAREQRKREERAMRRAEQATAAFGSAA